MREFRVDIAEADLEDLRRRLAAVRWPNEVPDVGWERGVPLNYLRELADYWRTSFDWTAAEARINQFPQFTTTIDGANIHFLHVRSSEQNAVPLLLTHGWPGSFVEFLEVIERLTDPRAYGGEPSDAFHVVIPTIPGFGFSGPTDGSSWTVGRVAGAWAQLMRQLGYDRYIPQGGDLGAGISAMLAAIDSEHVIGVHVNFLITPPTDDPADLAGLTDSDIARLGLLSRFTGELSGYMKLQSTRPQTLSYALTDSPVGQLAWIVERFKDWADAPKSPDDAVDRDQLLTNVSLYWLTATAGSSANFYFDNADIMPTALTPPPPPPPLTVPFGVAVYPYDAAQAIRRFAERSFPNIVQWSEFERGGHFAAMEEPDLFVADLQAFGRTLRAL